MPPGHRVRVALVSFDFGEYCIQLANALSAQADVLLVLPDHFVGHPRGLNSSVRLHAFRKPRMRHAFRQFHTIRAIFQRIRQFSPDIVHYQGVHLWFDLALPFLSRYPLVFTVHDFRPHPGDQRFQQTPFFIEMFARRRADQIIVHTQHARALLLRHLNGRGGRISVIPHVQIGESVPSAAQEDEGLVLFFGRIWKYKGLDYLIRAEPLITARVPHARILIAGQGEDFSRYTRMMANPDRFIVDNAFISEERAAEYFRRACVVALPYTEASQSGVIPMAYSAGKPVVATTVGGLPEMVEHGRTGYLVPPRDVAQLADAVVKLLLDAPLRHSMGMNGKRNTESKWSLDAIGRKTIQVYHRALESFARSRARPAPQLRRLLHG